MSKKGHAWIILAIVAVFAVVGLVFITGPRSPTGAQAASPRQDDACCYERTMPDGTTATFESDCEKIEVIQVGEPELCGEVGFSAEKCCRYAYFLDDTLIKEDLASCNRVEMKKMNEGPCGSTCEAATNLPSCPGSMYDEQNPCAIECDPNNPTVVCGFNAGCTNYGDINCCTS